jgi:arginine:ornithine antiporter/lysine permease
MAAEVLFVAARNSDMPRFLRSLNTKDVPVAALLLTSALSQVVLLTTLWSDDAFTFTLKLCTSLSLVPYLLAAAYALRLGVTRETYTGDRARGHAKEFVIAAIATVYTLFLIVAAGVEFLLMSCIVYAPGTVLFVLARREQGKRVFTPVELGLFVIAVIGAVAGIVGLVTGWITI